MVEITIRCPICKNQFIVHGKTQEKIFVTCPTCNTRGEFTLPSDVYVPTAQKEKNTMRPKGVTILAILAIIGALISVYSFISYVYHLSIFPDSSILQSFFMLSMPLSIVSIILSFVIAYGFWKGLRWSWFVAMILLIIGITIPIIFVPWTFIMLSRVSPTDIFNPFILVTTVQTLIFVALYGTIIFYLTRPHVRTYFHIGKPGDIKSTIIANRKIVYPLAFVFIIIAIIILWGFRSTDTIRLINLTQTPENPDAFDDVTITAEITGGSSFGGAGASLSYITYFGEGGTSGSKAMRSIGDNKYSATFRDSNGTEIWCLIIAVNDILAEHTIQIGHIERSNKTSLAITNFTQVPEDSTSETTSFTITVNVTSNVSVTDVVFMREIISPSGYSSSGSWGMQKKYNNIYSETLTPIVADGMWPRTSGEYQQKNFESGTQIYYRIAAQDSSGNTAVITKHIII
jgi:MFS family permease